MSAVITVLVDSVCRVGFAQLPHAVAGAAALYLGRRYPRPMRLSLWLSCAVFFTALGSAGYLWGRPGMPLLLSAPLDPYLFRPVPGLIELGSADHVAQLALGVFFAGASFATAWSWARLVVEARSGVKPRGEPAARKREAALTR